MRLAVLVGKLGGERAEGSARELPRRFHDDLYGFLEIELCRNRHPESMQRLECLRFLAKQTRRVSARACKLKVGLDPREQFARRERLDQIIVGTRTQPFNLRLLACPGGEQDHGSALELVLSA